MNLKIFKKFKIKNVFLLVFFIFTDFFAKSEILVNSPVSGTWSNPQMLVIQTESESEYFYSLNGENPELSGFAYDGPVLIDMSGEINLKIVKISRNSTERKDVSYKVLPDRGLSKNYSSFITTFFDSGVINYSAGGIISIPSELKYFLGNEATYETSENSFIQGRNLILDSNCILKRDIPCVIFDSESGKKWRFYIRTYPQTAGIYSRRDVPFKVSDWNKISFTSKNLLYKIDSGYWFYPEEDVVLDRSVNHMISWQSLSYEQGNPVEFFLLPPKPVISTVSDEDGTLTLNISGDDSYKMSIIENENDLHELFETVSIDVFYGDKESGVIELGIYSSSVYQGSMTVDYNIDKCPPKIPEIKSQAKNFINRENVELTIEGNSTSDLYVAVSDAFIIENPQMIFTKDSEIFKNVNAENFTRQDKSLVNINLQEIPGKSVYYKVCAYTKNGKNESQINEYSVIIDPYNYFYDSQKTESDSESLQKTSGTFENPYTDFFECLKDISKIRNARLYLKSDANFLNEQFTLSTNLEILSENGNSIYFEENSSLVVKNSSLVVNGIKFIRENKNHENDLSIPVLKLENSVLSMENCIILANFSQNALFMDSFASYVFIKTCIASVKADFYSSFASGVNSRFTVENSDISVNGGTSVVFSLNGGEHSFSQNRFTILGKAGHALEFFDSKADVFSNKSLCNLTRKSQNYTSFYSDKNSKVILKDNSEEWFLEI